MPTYNSRDLRISLKQAASQGIATAEFYLKSLAQQFGQAEAAKIYCQSPNVKWAVALKQSRSEFTFHQKGMDVSQEVAVDQGTGIEAGAYAEYEAVIGTSHKDWDGDIVEPAGYTIDPKSPVLWMHAHGMPLGSLKSIISHDKDHAKCRFKVADTTLGRDAVKLMQVGALRKSIGFKPSELSPLGFRKDKDGREVPAGWHVKKSFILENSLVSIPANSNTSVDDVFVSKAFEKQIDAIRTLASRGELEDSRIKSWGKSHLESRSVAVRGFTPEVVEQLAVKVADAISNKQVVAESTEGEVRTQKFYGVDGYLPASAEERIDKVGSAVYWFFKNHRSQITETDEHDCYCYVVATYTEHAYVVVRDYKKDERSYYQFDYAINSDGKYKVTGTTRIEITTLISPVGSDDENADGFITKLESIEKSFKQPATPEKPISLIRKGVGILLLDDADVDENLVQEVTEASKSLKRQLDVKQLRAIGFGL